MTRIHEIIAELEKAYPLKIAESWDNPGYQIGNPNGNVSKVLTALEITSDVIDQALEFGCELILTHHPLFFKPVKSLQEGKMPDDDIFRLIRAGISVYSAHTNLDTAAMGLNQFLCERIGLNKIRPLNRQYVEKYYKLETVLFDEEAAKLKTVLESRFMKNIELIDIQFHSYDTKETFFSVSGKADCISRVCSFIENNLKRKISFVKYVLEFPNESFSLGRVGEITEPMTLKDWALQVKSALKIDHILVSGNPNQMIKKIGVVSGAGIEFMRDAKSKGCDVLLTGDVKHHDAQAAGEIGLAIVDAGHQGTEQIVSELFKDFLDKQKIVHGWQIEVIQASLSERIYCL